MNGSGIYELEANSCTITMPNFLDLQTGDMRARGITFEIVDCQ